MGGAPPETTYNYMHTNITSYIGCIRNLVVDGNTQDFSNALNQDQVTTGCRYTDQHCSPNPCANGGKCMGVWGGGGEENSGHVCDCLPSQAGVNCTEGKCPIQPFLCVLLLPQSLLLPTHILFVSQDQFLVHLMVQYPSS